MMMTISYIFRLSGSFRLNHLLLLSLSVVIISTGSCYEKSVDAVNQMESSLILSTPTARPSPEDICGNRRKLGRDHGFEIPGLREAKKQKTRVENVLTGNGSKEILISSLKPKYEKINLDIAEDLLKLSGDNWIVNGIGEYRIGDKIFQYYVTAYPDGIGADFEFVYTDTDGDGTFDLVCQKEGLKLPALPSWLRP